MWGQLASLTLCHRCVDAVQAMIVALGALRDMLPFNSAPGYSDTGATNPFVQGQCAITMSTMVVFKVCCSCQQGSPAWPPHSRLAEAFPPQRPGAEGCNTLLTPRGGAFPPLSPPQAAQLVGKLGGRVGTAALPGSTVVLDRATRE